MRSTFKYIIYAYISACLLISTAANATLPDPIKFAWLVERGDIKQVEEWFSEGLDPEFQHPQLGTGLMIAAWYGNIEMMEVFIKHGANPRRSNLNGEQPLQLAAWNGHMNAVKWLLEHGAVLNREGLYWGALHYAVFNGNKELTNYLLSKGASVNARSPNGATPIILAAREGREELTKVLLDAGADTTLKTDWGDSALTMAMRYDHYSLAKMISSPEEFAAAIKAPKESFGVATSSKAAPNEIEVLLKKIREADIEGLASDDLHKQLMEAVTKYKENAVAKSTKTSVSTPKSIVITAKRNQPGAESARIVLDERSTSKTIPVKTGPLNDVSNLMRQIREEEAKGNSTVELKKQLYEAGQLLKPIRP